MTMVPVHGVYHLLGLAKNHRLLRKIGNELSPKLASG